MNAAFASGLLVIAFMAAASAHHQELCHKSDPVLVIELACIEQRISAEANTAFQAAVAKLNCNDRACAMRKLCTAADLNKEMLKYFTIKQIGEIHNAATACDPDVQSHQH
ncbi:antimicrobial peptide microplusin-like [Haemaphysalis longicornis]